MATFYILNDAYISHHGIKGMKWGVRRYQNADGSLTNAGRIRYGEPVTRKEKKFAKKITKNLENSAKLATAVNNSYYYKIYPERRSQAIRQLQDNAKKRNDELIKQMDEDTKVKIDKAQKDLYESRRKISMIANIYYTDFHQKHSIEINKLNYDTSLTREEYSKKMDELFIKYLNKKDKNACNEYKKAIDTETKSKNNLKNEVEKYVKDKIGTEYYNKKLSDVVKDPRIHNNRTVGESLSEALANRPLNLLAINGVSNTGFREVERSFDADQSERRGTANSTTSSSDFDPDRRIIVPNNSNNSSSSSSSFDPDKRF